MIIDILASDPRTPPRTLAWLARRADLTASEALALSSNPRLPAGATVTVPTLDSDDLRNALHADLPPHLRAQHLAATPADEITSLLGAHDVLTTAELVAHHGAHPPRTVPEHLAYLRNTATPATIAHASIDANRGLTDAIVIGAIEDLVTATLTLEAASVRHRATPVGKHAAYSLTTSDPDAAYAHQLISHAATLGPRRQLDWWPAAIVAHPHPNLISAALTYARAHPPTGRDRRGAPSRRPPSPEAFVTDRILTAILTSTRTGPEAHHEALTLMAPNSPDFTEHATVAHPDALAAAVIDAHFATFPATWPARCCAAQNPHATAPTLHALFDILTTEDLTGSVTHALADLTCHPNTSPQLRSAIAAYAPAGDTNTLARHLQTTTTAPPGLLDVPYEALRTGPHAHHWATRAYATQTGPPVTPELAEVLISLEGATFPGTFRQLLTTAQTVTASTN